MGARFIEVDVFTDEEGEVGEPVRVDTYSVNVNKISYIIDGVEDTCIVLDSGKSLNVVESYEEIMRDIQDEEYQD